MYIIAQLVAKSISDGYLVGSRGSVGSSFVANMAGIMKLIRCQPIISVPTANIRNFSQTAAMIVALTFRQKTALIVELSLKRDGYDIPFETFLGFDGDKAPDIDLNFSGEYQPTAHKYTEALFGEGHVFRA